jgi:hypothetical protein
MRLGTVGSYLMAHLYQIQIPTAGGIPLAFLFLLKFFEREELKDILLFSLFFLFQALANGYYAFYLTLFAGLVILIMTISEKKYKKKDFWLKLALFALIAAPVISPFAYQSLQMQKEMAFSWQVEVQPALTSFLATSPINKIYGKLTASFLKPECEMFPGMVALLLAMMSVGYGLKIVKEDKTIHIKKEKRPSFFARRSFIVLTILLVSLVVLTILYGGVKLLSVTFRISPVNIASVLLLLLGLFLVLMAKLRKIRLFNDEQKPLRLFSIILILSFLFSFGPAGTYFLLSQFVPGFWGFESLLAFIFLSSFL